MEEKKPRLLSSKYQKLKPRTSRKGRGGSKPPAAQEASGKPREEPPVNRGDQKAAIAGSATNAPSPEELERLYKRERLAIEAQERREREAFEAVQRDNGRGGAAEALRFLAKRAMERQIRSSTSIQVLRKALRTGPFSFDEYRALGTSHLEREIVRLVLQAAEAPRSLQEIKDFLPISNGPKIKPNRVLRKAANVTKAITVIEELEADRYWRELNIPGLMENLADYRDRLLRVSERLLRLDKSPTFKNAGHRHDEWVLQKIRNLTGRTYREKTTAIMLIVYPLAGHRPVETDSLRRWQQRRRTR